MNFAFVDGSVDSTRLRVDGGADYGGVCAVVVKAGDVVKGIDDKLVFTKLLPKMRIVGCLFRKSRSDDGMITNNTMELRAVGIACALLAKEIDTGEDVKIWTDSQYAQGCLRYDTSWCPKENLDVIGEIRTLTAQPHVQINHVRGHKRLAWNELADLGARKCVALRDSRDGFDGTRRLNIPVACFFCKRFACGDRYFGTRTSALVRGYDPCPCGGKNFLPHSPDLVERFQWKLTCKTG